MAKHIVATNLNLQPEVRIKIVGDIAPDTKPQDGDVFSIPSFRIELGKDYGDIGLHFSTHFSHANDIKIIVYSSRNDYIYIIFEEKQFKVKLPGGSEFTFPNHLNLQLINFLEITKDFKLRMLSFE
ncbi:galectin-1-like [Phascolarctos cinereus]